MALEQQPTHTLALRLREIAQRIEVARFHPDKALKRQAQGIVATSDAPGLLVAVDSLLRRVAELEGQMRDIIADSHDGMTFWLASLALAGGEVRFDKAWFDAFTPSGGWDVEITETEFIVRHRTDTELEALRKADEEATDGPRDE